MKKTTILEMFITLNSLALLRTINNNDISPTGLVWSMFVMIITLIIFCTVYMQALTDRDVELDNDLYEHMYGMENETTLSNI